MDPAVGDIVLALCRVLSPRKFIPKDQMRPAWVRRRYVDEWGIDHVDVEFLPGPPGEEITLVPWGTQHAVDTIRPPEIVSLVGTIELTP